MQRRQEAKNSYEPDPEDDRGFPEIVEEEGFDSDDNQQMTMEARS